MSASTHLQWLHDCHDAELALVRCLVREVAKPHTPEELARLTAKIDHHTAVAIQISHEWV